MTTFLQFHVLMKMGPSNPNRDDQGRPKQAMVGGYPRLRMSSQAIKRALRTSSYFQVDLAGHMGTRTKRFNEKLYEFLLGHNIPAERAQDVAGEIAQVFGKLAAAKEKENRVATTLSFISPEEWKCAEKAALNMAHDGTAPSEDELKKLILRTSDGAIDLAMFGRMLAADPNYNREAAVQVSHAITTHNAHAEEDWFTAVDDLNRDESTGAGHIGEVIFGSGVYYQYVCVNCDLLIENLGGDKELAARGAEALAWAIPVVTPNGKRNSFANNPRADFMLVEAGTNAPRDLSGAFFKAIDAPDLMDASITALNKTRSDIDTTFGRQYDDDVRMQVGTDFALQQAVAFVGSTVRAM